MSNKIKFDRQDLKDFRYNKISLKTRRELLSESRTEIENISSVLDGMPKRDQNRTRQFC